MTLQLSSKILWKGKIHPANFDSHCMAIEHDFLGDIECSFFLHECRKNLLISEPSQDIMEKFQCHLAPPNIKYNCVVLFLSQLYLLFIYASKYFPMDHHCKNQTELSDFLEKGKI